MRDKTVGKRVAPTRDHIPLTCVPDKHAAVFVRVGPAGRMGFLVDPAVVIHAIHLPWILAISRSCTGRHNAPALAIAYRPP